MKPTITITVKVEGETITVYDDAGNSRELKSIIVTGGDFESQSFYLFGWGSSADAGWSLAEGFRWAHKSKYQEAPFYRRAWAHCMKWICTYLGVDDLKRISPSDLLERWESEDEERRQNAEGKIYH